MRLHADLGWSPTVREIATACGTTVSVAWFHLGKLRAEGLIAMEDERARTIRPLVRRIS